MEWKFRKLYGSKVSVDFNSWGFSNSPQVLDLDDQLQFLQFFE